MLLDVIYITNSQCHILHTGCISLTLVSSNISQNFHKNWVIESNRRLDVVISITYKLNVGLVWIGKMFCLHFHFPVFTNSYKKIKKTILFSFFFCFHHFQYKYSETRNKMIIRWHFCYYMWKQEIQIEKVFSKWNKS